MATSTEVVISPNAGLFEWEHPRGVARFVEFALTLTPPYRQIDLKYENPFCLIAGRTSVGSRVCGQGCGMDCAAPPASHVCPFGLMMVRAGQAAGAVRWVGRRFSDVESMHAGLDLLLAEGLDEDALLDSLPPNPVVAPEELREVAGAVQGSAGVVEPIPVRPTPADQGKPAKQACATGLLEYLEQVHRLLAEAATPESLCERMLQAVAVMAPFDEMAIYLRRLDGATPWTLASLVRPEDKAASMALANCLIDPFVAHLEAGGARRSLVLTDGRVRPFDGEITAGMTIAVPLPLVGSNLLGVWLVHQGAAPTPCAPGRDVPQMLRILSDFLAMRLTHLLRLADPACASPASRDGLIRTLSAEAARAARQDQPFSLLCLRVFGRSSAVALPAAELTREFTSALRPYDTLITDLLPSNTWFAVLPGAGEEAARLVGGRLATIFEDRMDACGGTEEQGLRLGIGVSAWGVDSTDPEAMIACAGSAAAQLETAAHSAIREDDAV